MQLCKVTGTFEMLVLVYSEEHARDLVESMNSENPKTGEKFVLEIASVEEVKQ